MLQRFLYQIATLFPAPRGTMPISALCYHGTYFTGTHSHSLDRFSVSINALKKQFECIANSRRPVILPGDLPSSRGPAVILTFDDNLKSHTSLTLPLLKDYGLRAAFFLSPGDIGKTGQLSWNDVEKLVSADMHLGAHNSIHLTAVAFDHSQFVSAVKMCQKFLLEFGMPLTWSYPGGSIGSFGREHESILLDNGFYVRFSTLEGVCRPAQLNRPQRRYVIRHDTSDRYFGSALAGGLQVIAAFKLMQANFNFGDARKRAKIVT